MYFNEKDATGWPSINGNQVVISSKVCSSEVMDYHITIRREFQSAEELLKAANWAEINCVGPWLIGCVSSGFIRNEDAIYFKLKWA